MEETMKTKGFKIAVMAAGVVLVAIIFFAGGLVVGLAKSKFSNKFGFEGRHGRNFANMPYSGPTGMGMMGADGFQRRGMMDDFGGCDSCNNRGVSGTITSVADGKIVIKTPNGQEKTVSVSDKTIIRRGARPT